MYLGGNPNNIVNFYKLKKKYNFYLIEDSCHALGSSYYFKKKKKNWQLLSFRYRNFFLCIQ